LADASTIIAPSESVASERTTTAPFELAAPECAMSAPAGNDATVTVPLEVPHNDDDDDSDDDNDDNVMMMMMMIMMMKSGAMRQGVDPTKFSLHSMILFMEKWKSAMACLSY
jgi:hypothetical protein